MDASNSEMEMKMADLKDRPAVRGVGRGHAQGMVRNEPAADHFKPGAAVGDSSLSTAVEELHGQHPTKWNDLGPHHHK